MDGSENSIIIFTELKDRLRWKGLSPKTQLDTFIDRFTPEIAALTRAVLEKMRARLPGAVEMVYDNTYALVVGFGPTDRASDAPFSIAVYPRWINLFFLEGAFLPDPQKVLKGSGNVVRHIRIDEAGDLDSPAIQALMKEALKRAEKPFDKRAPGRMVIKAIAAKQRPRRPVSTRARR